jgi:predicted amidohydrolase YtcJ
VPGLSALLVAAGRIAWIGPDSDAPAADTTIDLDGALVLPGFVDAHAHVTETGLLLSGLDLSSTGSAREILDLVAAAARARPGRVVLGHGWDELQLAERRPPSAAELDRAAAGGEVYLSRVDVHSAVVSGALAERAGLPGMLGWDRSGRVERDAHHAVRHLTRFRIDPGDRRALQERALRSAAAAGITELHEMSAPHVAPVQDLVDLVALVNEAGPGAFPGPGTAESGTPGAALPDVVPYRGDLAGSEQDARRIVAELAGAGLPWLAGLAGDLMVDGSIGSRTAALSADYADAPGHRGHLYLDSDQVRDHVVACTRAGLQAGFHVIGDAAVAGVIAGFEAAAAMLGPAALRAARHRLEHLEMLDDAGVVAASRLGLIASVQPAFDAAWGGTERMYAVRLGPQRAVGLNPFAAMTAAGVRLAFGSDSPVTPFSPWEAIRAALRHRTPQQRIGLGPALLAHTAGGRSAAAPRRQESPVGGSVGGSVSGSGRTGIAADWLAGPAVGDPATFTGWRASAQLDVLGESLIAGEPVPDCVLTVIRGRIAVRTV